MARTIKTGSVMKLIEGKKDKNTEGAAEVRIKRMAWGEQGTLDFAATEPAPEEITAHTAGSAKLYENSRKYADKWEKFYGKK